METQKITVGLSAKFSNGSRYDGSYEGTLEEVGAYLERMKKAFELLDEPVAPTK